MAFIGIQIGVWGRKVVIRRQPVSSTKVFLAVSTLWLANTILGVCLAYWPYRSLFQSGIYFLIFISIGSLFGTYMLLMRELISSRTQILTMLTFMVPAHISLFTADVRAGDYTRGDWLAAIVFIILSLLLISTLIRGYMRKRTLSPKRVVNARVPPCVAQMKKKGGD